MTDIGSNLPAVQPEAKSLIQDLPSLALELDEESQNFLTNPARTKLLIEFSIGSNKLSLYGQPFTMAKNSELIESNITTYANSTPPHPLLTFGVVLERPMTMLWLYLNEFPHDFSQLSLLEMLHMYRLCDYLGVGDIFDITKSILRKLKYNKDVLSDSDKKTITRILTTSDRPFLSLPDVIDVYMTIQEMDETLKASLRRDIFKGFLVYHGHIRTDDQKVVADVINQILSQPDQVGWKDILDHLHIVTENMTKARMIEEVLKQLFSTALSPSAHKNIGKQINYIPVYIDGDIETYAERKIATKTLGRLNGDWKYNPDNATFTKRVDDEYITLKVEGWGSNGINLVFFDRSPSLDKITGAANEVLLNPILL